MGKTEEEYAAELLEQMKLDIAASADNSYTEEVSDTSAVPSEKETEAGESSGNAPEKRRLSGKDPYGVPRGRRRRSRSLTFPLPTGSAGPRSLPPLRSW